MPTLEEIFKAQGFTDADLEAVKPLLTDARYRNAVEGEISRLANENTIFKTENEKWSNWHETEGKPTLALYEKDMTDAKAEAASLRERLRLAEANGFAPRRDEQQPPANQPPANAAFDPKAHKLITEDEFKAQTMRFADLEGQAIAISGNLIEEYRHLTGGKSIIDYTYQTQDGRTLHGLEALRFEAQLNKQPMYEYAQKKFDFAAKRQAIADAQRKAAEDAIRADERAKVVQQYGQPGAGPMMPSSQPFIPRPSGNEGKQPWDRGTDNERRSDRIQRAMQTQLRSGAVQ